MTIAGEFMMNPMVSIIIPVYNGANYLNEAINSALAQTYKNTEIVVVNDGSSDEGETKKICLSFGDKIRYFEKENGGVATAVNFGLEKMRGEYFSWLSHDDIYYPDKLEKQISLICKTGDKYTIVHSNYDFLIMPARRLSHVRVDKIYACEQLSNSVFPVVMSAINACTLIFHKDHFNRVGVLDKKLATSQDYDFMFRLLRGQRSIFMPEPTVKIRLHESQGTNTISVFASEQTAIYLKFIDELTQTELEEMQLSPSIFYHRIMGLLKSRCMDKAYKSVSCKLNMLSANNINFDEAVQFKEHLNLLSEKKAKKLCIFGLGQYGQRLWFDLWGRDISIDFFCDNNPQKWGTSFEGIPCVSPVELQKYKNATLVIVAAREPDEMVAQLKALKFDYVATRQGLEKYLLQAQPTRW